MQTLSVNKALNVTQKVVTYVYLKVPIVPILIQIHVNGKCIVNPLFLDFGTASIEIDGLLSVVSESVCVNTPQTTQSIKSSVCSYLSRLVSDNINIHNGDKYRFP